MARGQGSEQDGHAESDQSLIAKGFAGSARPVERLLRGGSRAPPAPAMIPPASFERYPIGTVLAANAVSLAIYGLGTAIMARYGTGPALVYAACCLWVEFRVLTKSCRSCWYYGRRCGFGKGRFCALLFPKGDPADFLRKEITWWDLVPDFAVGLLPALAGAVLLARHFSWTLLLLVVLLLVLSTAGNAYVRGVLVCRHCRQRELGCPAQRLFEPSP